MITAHIPSEEWRPVSGYEELYAISDKGRVKSLTRIIHYKDGRHRPTPEKIITPSIDTSGYPTVTLSKNSVRKQSRIHKLVTEAFLGPCPDGLIVCHQDGNPANNHVSNLRYDTYKSNAEDMERHGRNFYRNKTHCKRGHALDGPNVAPWEKKRGRRTCLACSRARGYLVNYPDQKHRLKEL